MQTEEKKREKESEQMAAADSVAFLGGKTSLASAVIKSHILNLLGN